MGAWVLYSGETEWVEPVPQQPDAFIVTDNDVVATLLGSHGEVILQVLEREPFGFKPGRWPDGRTVGVHGDGVELRRS